MGVGQDQETPQNAVINIAIAFAYENFPDLEERRVVVNARDCNAKRIIHHLQAMGPGEAIETALPDEEWEVSVLLKVFSSVLVITVYRNNDGSLDVIKFDSRSL